MRANQNKVIKPDGSVVGMWRDHNPGGHYSTPHIFTATNWSNPTTYKWNSEPLFSDKVVKGGIEDMFLWVDERGGYHAIFHLMYGCGTCGSHAYSADGLHWTYTGIAYTATTKFTDGTTTVFPYVERPHLVFDETGIKPVALTNGVKYGLQPGIQNDDQSYTLLRPLAQ